MLEHLAEYKIIDQVKFSSLKVGDVFIPPYCPEFYPRVCHYVYAINDPYLYTLYCINKHICDTTSWDKFKNSNMYVYLTGLTLDFVDRK